MINSRKHISEMILANAKDPKKTALQLLSGEVLTYGELLFLNSLTQAALSQMNIEAHERIALITDNSLLYLPMMIAIMERSTCVPLENDWNTEQYQEYFELLSVDYLMCDQTDGPAVEAAAACGIGIIKFDTTESNYPSSVRFQLVRQSSIPSNQAFKNDQTAFIFTTSGTTSKPKIVPILYRNLADVLGCEASNYDYAEDSIQLLVVKLCRAIAIRVALRVLIFNGRIIYIDGMYPKRIADALLNLPVTHLSLQPAGMLALNDYFQKNFIDFSPQHRLYVNLGGAPLQPQLVNDIEKRFNAQLVYGYGMTEVGRISSLHKASKGYKQGSVGCSVGPEIKIHNNEVLVRGPGVFPGYENDPGMNRDTFIDGWFRTGDVGYIDEDGYLFIQGRTKELINRGGEKVSPYEVEEAIQSLLKLKDIAVFPYPNMRGYENVAAVVVPGEMPIISLRALRAALKEKMKPFKLPTLLYVVDEIPTSSAQKIQRSLLYQQLKDLGITPESSRSQSNHEEPDLTYTQSGIQDIWKSILGQEHVSLDDDFFDIGGDSLSAAEVLASIEARFGCMLPINEFFSKSSIRDLAILVDQAPRSNGFKHLVPLRPGGSKTPIFFVHETSGEVVTYHHITAFIEQNRPVYGLRCNWQGAAWDEATSLRVVALAYVAEIQKTWPDGPFYIAGLSIGGQIGFEMGCLLSEQGHDVIVFMIDTFSREHIRNNAIVKAVQYTVSGLKTTPSSQLPKLIYKKAGTFYRVFVRWGIFHKPVQIKAPPPYQEADETQAIKDPTQKFVMALSKKHRPVFFPGEICYFRASIKSSNYKPSHLAWKQLSRKFTLIEADCRHSDFVQPEYAAYTAGEINGILASRERLDKNDLDMKRK